MWSLVTLGSLRLVDVRSGADCLPGRRKELVLLSFLARRAPRMVPRAVLAELLWGDKDEDRARASLRQALSQLRRTLGDALDVGTDSVALSPDAVVLDIKQLEDSAAAGNWNRVIDQCTGEFLVGHDEVGGESYREWVDGERARLTRIMDRAYTALIENAERRGAANETLTIARRWHDAFPDDESAGDALTRALHAVQATLPGALEILAPMTAGAATQITASPTSPRLKSGRWVVYGGGLIAALAAVVATARSSLIRAGSAPMDDVQTVIVPDVRAVGVDTMLAQVISELLRIDLRQSRSLSVYPPAAAQQALRQLDSSATRIDVETARQIATRDGIKVVTDGEVVGSGSQYLLSVRLIAATSGAELVDASASATNRDELMTAVDVVAGKLRHGAGETLRNVENARPIERVTSNSLDALIKYVRATRAIDIEGAIGKGHRLLDEAIALDSTFAMAYRKLAVELNDRGGNEARVRDLIEHAYAFRERLTDPERYAVEAAYYSFGPVPDEDKAIAAYEAALEANPRFGLPRINLSGIALRRHQFTRAESLAQEAVTLATSTVQGHWNLAFAQVNSGKLDAAAATIAHLDSASPGSPAISVARARLLNARGASDSAEKLLRHVFDGTTDIVRRNETARLLRDLSLARGSVSDARRWTLIWTETAEKRNLPAAALNGALDQAWITLWFDHDTAAALRAAAAALRQYRLDSIRPLDRPYGKLIRLFAWSDRPVRAKAALAGYDSATGSHPRIGARWLGRRYRGEVAFAEHRYDDAIASFLAADSTECAICLLPFLAITYERMGVPDSSRALWRRYVETPDFGRFESDASFLQLARQESPVRDTRVKSPIRP